MRFETEMDGQGLRQLSLVNPGKDSRPHSRSHGGPLISFKQGDDVKFACLKDLSGC